MVLVRSRAVLHHPFAPWLAPPEQLERTLVGREEVLKNVCEKLEAMAKGGSAKHVLLIGPRGMGKTHLVCFVYHYVLQRIAIRPDLPITPEKWTAVLFVEEEYAAHNTLANFLLSLCAKLRESDPEEKAWQLPESLPEQSDRVVTDCCFERLQEFAVKRGRKLLVLVDNMQKILQQFPMEDHHRLRAFLMDQTAMLLVGTAPWLFNEVIDSKAPFFEFFETIYLADLTAEEMLYLLETRFQEEGLEAEFQKRRENLRRKLPAIRRLTGGNPRLILFLYHIVTRSAFLEVESALRELIEELSDYFRGRYDTLADQPRKVLDTLAQMPGPGTPTDIARAARLNVQKVNAQLKRLKEWGYVEPAKHGRGRATYYDITERLFRIWRQTATVAGCQRFRFLAQFLKIYYTPEEMAGIVHTYRRGILTGELVHTSEYCRNAVEDLYYFQEAGSGTLRHEAFALRMAAFIKATDLQPEEARYWRLQSRVLDDLERHAEALACAERATELQPDDVRSWERCGWAAVNLGNYEKVLESFQKATALQPEEARYWHLQAMTFSNLKRYTEALSCAERAVELQPDNAHFWEWQGVAANDLGDHTKALDSFQKATTLRPEDAHNWQRQAQILPSFDRYAEALVCIERAIELQPNDGRLLITRASILHDLGRTQEALQTLEKLLEQKVVERDILDAYGYILLLSGRFKEARKAFEKGLTVAPDDWELGIEREIVRACQGEHGPNMESLVPAIIMIQAPSNMLPSIVHFILKVAMNCAMRDDLDRAHCLLDVILSLPWQQEEWFGQSLGVFLGKLLDGPPSAFEMAIDQVKEKVVEPNVLTVLEPYLHAAAYSQTDDTSILDRLFPEVRELVLEIAQRLRHRCTSPVKNSGSQ